MDPKDLREYVTGERGRLAVLTQGRPWAAGLEDVRDVLTQQGANLDLDLDLAPVRRMLGAVEAALTRLISSRHWRR